MQPLWVPRKSLRPRTRGRGFKITLNGLHTGYMSPRNLRGRIRSCRLNSKGRGTVRITVYEAHLLVYNDKRCPPVMRLSMKAKGRDPSSTPENCREEPSVTDTSAVTDLYRGPDEQDKSEVVFDSVPVALCLVGKILSLPKINVKHKDH